MIRNAAFAFTQGRKGTGELKEERKNEEMCSFSIDRNLSHITVQDVCLSKSVFRSSKCGFDFFFPALSLIHLSKDQGTWCFGRTKVSCLARREENTTAWRVENAAGRDTASAGPNRAQIGFGAALISTLKAQPTRWTEPKRVKCAGCP